MTPEMSLYLAKQPCHPLFERTCKWKRSRRVIQWWRHSAHWDVGCSPRGIGSCLLPALTVMNKSDSSQWTITELTGEVCSDPSSALGTIVILENTINFGVSKFLYFAVSPIFGTVLFSFFFFQSDIPQKWDFTLSCIVNHEQPNLSNQSLVHWFPLALQTFKFYIQQYKCLTLAFTSHFVNVESSIKFNTLLESS